MAPSFPTHERRGAGVEVGVQDGTLQVSEMTKPSSRTHGKNAATNRVDANDIAMRLGVTIETLARMIGVKCSALRRRAGSRDVEARLRDAARVYDALAIIFPLDETIARWMLDPLRSLEGMTAIELAEKHGIAALRELTEAMAAGGYL